MKIIAKYRWFIIIITVLATVGSLVYSYIKPAYFDTSISFSINRINMQTTEDYQYDGYYAIQASDLFSQTVMSWFMTPSVLLEIYEKANIDPQITSIESFTSRFKTKKYSPQNIVVRYHERDYETADAIATAIIDIVENKAAEANQTSDDKALFEVVSSKPVIVERKPVVWLNTVIGFVAGLLFSVVVAYFVEYWRREERMEASGGSEQ